MYNAICDELHRELSDIDARYVNGGRMTEQELDHINKITHTLKSMKTYAAMVEAEENGSAYKGYSRDRRYDDRYRDEGYRRY